MIITLFIWKEAKGRQYYFCTVILRNKDNWIQFAAYLTKDYHVVIPDIPGYGESSKIDG